jgi:SAM-dependent methyltransferase
MARVSGSTKPPGDDRRSIVIDSPIGLADEHPGDDRGRDDAASKRSRVALAHTADAASRRIADLCDRLVAEVVLRHSVGRATLDLGHGAPQIATWVRPRAASLTVVDAVDLGHGAEVRLPWRDRSFEVVYSLRTLPHLGHDERSSESAVRSLLGEIRRVLVPGGVALCLVDNPRSLWGAYYGIRNLGELIERGPLVVESTRGITRFDTLGRLVDMLPPGLTLTEHHGVRVFTVLPHLLDLPLVGRVLERLEWFARDRALLRGFAAHLLAVIRRFDAVAGEGR